MSKTVMPVIQNAPQGPDEWVFGDEIFETLYPNGVFDPNVEPAPNPAYRTELDLSISNANADLIMETLGLAREEDPGTGWLVPMARFIEAAFRCLEARMPVSDDDYLGVRVRQMLTIAFEGQSRGATHLQVH